MVEEPTLEAFVDQATAGAVDTVLSVDPIGSTCEACEEVVTRRWREGDAWVCVDCKTWDRE
ncbi:MAG: hypothetical protein ABEI31_02175 [Halodesulfurarchaeum sp.]